MKPKTSKVPPPLSQAEQALWRHYSQTVRPLSQRPVVEITPPRLSQTQLVMTHQQRQERPLLPAMPTHKLSDLRLNIGKKDRKPQMVEGRLDLHGLTQAQAYPEVSRFIERHYARGSRTLLIITGKGMFRGEDYQRGILAESLPQWLNQPPLRSYIRTFTHAHYKDGGSGAFYVFLKK